jgi:hypothetical protein
MNRPSNSPSIRVERNARLSALFGQVAALVVLCLVALPTLAVQVRIRDGQQVRLKLRNILTTDNVQKGDQIEFDVVEDILVNGHVVIAKGSAAHGKVVEVKGAGKPKAKDAEVVFEFTTVRAVDNQEIPLRIVPTKSRKSKSSENEVSERAPIPGYPSRLIGAEKGKDYVVFTDAPATINASETIVAAPVTPAAAHPAQPTTAEPAGGNPAAAPTTGPTPAITAPEPASVEFSSTPDGADIIIDGTFVGNTPSTLRVVPGHHSIEIRMAGYRSWTRTMVVDPESHPSVRATLMKE